MKHNHNMEPQNTQQQQSDSPTPLQEGQSGVAEQSSTAPAQSSASQAFPPTQEPKSGSSKMIIIIITLIIVLVIVGIGAYAYFSMTNSNSNMKYEDGTESMTNEQQEGDGGMLMEDQQNSMMEEVDLSPMPTLSNSDTVDAIEQDLQSTKVGELDEMVSSLEEK